MSSSSVHLQDRVDPSILGEMAQAELANLGNLTSSNFNASSSAITGKGRNTNLNMIDKLEVLKRIDANIPYSKISKEFNIAKGTVNKIKRSRDYIVESIEKHGAAGETRKRVRFSKDGKTLDGLLVSWVSELQDRNEMITGKLLQDKALELAAEHNLTTFKASNGWLQCFQRRHSINFRDKEQVQQPRYGSLDAGANQTRPVSAHARASRATETARQHHTAASVPLLDRQLDTWVRFKETISNDPFMLPLVPHVAAIDQHLSATRALPTSSSAVVASSL